MEIYKHISNPKGKTKLLSQASSLKIFKEYSLWGLLRCLKWSGWLCIMCVQLKHFDNGFHYQFFVWIIHKKTTFGKNIIQEICSLCNNWIINESTLKLLNTYFQYNRKSDNIILKDNVIPKTEIVDIKSQFVCL